MPKKWKMPEWMKPYAPHIVNTGANDPDRVAVVEEMYNGNADPRINLPLSTLQACVKSQVLFLHRLHGASMLKEPRAIDRVLAATRMQFALERIEQSVGMVLGSRAFPAKLRDGMEAIADDARTGLGK